MIDEAVRLRFWSKVAITADPDKCWLWQGALNNKGYGTLSCNGRGVRVHRLSIMLDGREMPADMDADHMCMVRACVNPKHLRAVDKRTSRIENSNSIAAINARKTHCDHGHPLSGDNLKITKKSRLCRVCLRAEEARWRDRRRAKGLPLRPRKACASGAAQLGESK